MVAAGMLTAACGRDNQSALTTMDVFAAASLTEAFTDLGRQFEAERDNVDLRFTFAASSTLARQIGQGAPADVFASADETTMMQAVEADDVRDPRVFARNRLALLVEKANPLAIRGLADLARPDVGFVVCAPAVPCGRAGAAALRAANIVAPPLSQEENVKAVVSRVVLGEADAGIVYVTDVKAAGDRAEGVAIDVAADPAVEPAYPIAVTARSDDGEVARRWVAFVLSGRGRATLEVYGFLPP